LSLADTADDEIETIAFSPRSALWSKVKKEFCRAVHESMVCAPVLQSN
jgi:hypothetical protein